MTAVAWTLLGIALFEGLAWWINAHDARTWRERYTAERLARMAAEGRTDDPTPLACVYDFPGGAL